MDQYTKHVIRQKLCEVTHLEIKYGVSCSGLFPKHSSTLKEYLKSKSLTVVIG